MLRLFRRRYQPAHQPTPASYDNADIDTVTTWIRSRFPHCDNPTVRAVGLLAHLTADRNRRKGL